MDKMDRVLPLQNAATVGSPGLGVLVSERERRRRMDLAGRAATLGGRLVARVQVRQTACCRPPMWSEAEMALLHEGRIDRGSRQVSRALVEASQLEAGVMKRPDSVVYGLESHALAAERFSKEEFERVELDVALFGDQPNLQMRLVLDHRFFFGKRARGSRELTGRHFHVEGLVGALVVVDSAEPIELLLLSTPVAGWRPSGARRQGGVHALMRSVLFGMPQIVDHWLNPELHELHTQPADARKRVRVDEW